MKFIDKIKNYIQSVRNRTEEEKRQATIVWTIIITIFIFILWLVIFSVSVFNQQSEDLLIRKQAEERARQISQKEFLAEEQKLPVTSAPANDFSLGEIIRDGVDSVVEGFWVVGSWLHK